MTGEESGTQDHQKTCPIEGCDWTREYDIDSYEAELAAEVDAEIHWRNQHDGQIPAGAGFGAHQCPECDAITGMEGSVSCSECGFIPTEARA